MFFQEARWDLQRLERGVSSDHGASTSLSETLLGANEAADSGETPQQTRQQHEGRLGRPEICLV